MDNRGKHPEGWRYRRYRRSDRNRRRSHGDDVRGWKVVKCSNRWLLQERAGGYNMIKPACSEHIDNRGKPEVPEVPEAWEHSSQYLEAHGGAPKKCRGVERFQGVLGRRTDDNRIHRGKGPEGRRPERTQVDEHDGAGEIPCKEGPDRSRVAVSERPGQVGIAGNAEGGKECKDNAGIITDWSGKAD
ncbi:hypothetical protein B0H11DRAFT_1900586 [Mycena galericulata]|nr:hypothetical protein B0H11DRAFT_1900578 [Mycena galericulata]KAJ7510230.1 hypothetical protein B0H11DRAFT_1900582 [Mycena galericulata]KAJ7510233.1 hypothetical protein B0H11DRAFT_1900586 [Mycena galericulata]